MGIIIPYYLTAHHIDVPGTKKNIQSHFSLSVVKWNLEKSGIQDIIIIGIYSLTIVRNRKAHIPFFSHPGFFPLWMVHLTALPFSIVQENPMFSRDDLRSGFGGVCSSRENWR